MDTALDMKPKDEQLSSLKVAELRKMLRGRNLPVSGKKAQLVARIQAHMAMGPTPESDERDESEDETPLTAAKTPFATRDPNRASVAGEDRSFDKASTPGTKKRRQRRLSLAVNNALLEVEKLTGVVPVGNR